MRDFSILKKRIFKYIDYKGISKYEFYQKTGISNGVLSQKTGMSEENTLKFLNYYPDINPSWLLTGKGSMLLDSNVSEPVAAYKKMPSVSNERGVPYYDVDFIGGFDVVLNNQTTKPNFYIDYEPFNQEADCWVNVSGDSMKPVVSQGDIVALKKFETWQQFVLYGQIYAIVTDDFRTIKIVSMGKDKDHFSLIPYNKSPEFIKQDIPKCLIRHMFKVKGSIKKFF